MIILLMHAFIFVISLMSYNIIKLILTTNKLIEQHYVDWKRNLNIILTLEELKWVTQEIDPFTPNEHSNQEEKDNFHSW